MIDLFYPPKPYELLNRSADFVHTLWDEAPPKQTREQRRVYENEWRKRNRMKIAAYSREWMRKKRNGLR